MAQITSGNGFKPDLSSSMMAGGPKGIVGKEEALRMEADALARLQREKRHTLSASSSSPSLSSLSTAKLQKTPSDSSFSSASKPETDLIVFPESEAKKRGDRDRLGDVDVDKLTTEELEKLLLEDFAVSSKATRPSSLLGCNLSASYPGTQAFTPSPLHHAGAWTPTGSQGPTFPSAPFPKQPCSFQNGFAPANRFFLSLPPQPPGTFVAFAPLRTPSPLVFPPPPPAPAAVSPEMAKLFDKIASTSEYVKAGGRSAENDLASAAKSLEPTPSAPPLALPTTTPLVMPGVSRVEWLDLDPLSMRKADGAEAPPPDTEEAGPAGDPWDAVLLDEGDGGGARSPPTRGRLQRPSPSQPRRGFGGASVTRSHSLNIPTKSSQQGQNSQWHSALALGIHCSGMLKGSEKAAFKHDDLHGADAQNQEIVAFCEDIAELRSKFPYDNLGTNPGYVLSPVIPQRGLAGDSGVKVSIEISDSQEPVTFTCDVSSPVELLITQALCWVHDDLSQVDIGSYILKVCGQGECCIKCCVLVCSACSKHTLGSHEYVQSCRKWETEIKLQLLCQNVIRKDLARTAEDDSSPIDLEKYLDQVERPFKETVTRRSLTSLLEGYHNQVNACLQNESTQYKTVDRVIHAVRHLCNTLDEVETSAITEAVKKVKHSANVPRAKPLETATQSSGGSTTAHVSPMEESLAGLTSAVYDLVKLYLRTFCPVTSQHAERGPGEGRSSTEASGTAEHLQFTLFAVHGITNAWVSSYEKYYLMCALTHNGRNLFKPVQSKKVGAYKSFFYHIKWDELIHFPMGVALLPLEAMLSLTLYGIPNQSASGSPDSNKQRRGPELLGRVSMPLFDFRGVLARGSKLLSLWSTPSSTLAGTVGRKWHQGERTILQVDFPSPTMDVQYVGPQSAGCPDPQQALEPLEPELQARLEQLCGRASTFGLTRADRLLLWDKRQYCRAQVHSLPKVLTSAPCWDSHSMAEIHTLLHHWPALSPVSALELLDSKFADTEVRAVAVGWIGSCSDDELADYLPQLVQAVKFECHLRNALVLLLLSRAQGNINIAHYLYWLLRDAVQDPCFGPRFESILGALLCLCGAGLRAELDKQTQLVQLLGALAEKVRQAGSSTRQAVLQDGLGRLRSFFQKQSCRLPLSPSLEAKELNVKACSFFNSNAVPLKIALVNADPLGDEINVMFKVGEDLRQDMLALQMIRIMDRIWLQEGLDLRIVEYGVTGSFKDKPLAEWLRKYNPTEDEYEKASENFVYSCAGCCVATYVLGICDRHNDNIMLRSTGHMFHIDFGKFLGHAQMFGSFKRDRAPFVLTSDMAYMTSSGLPELTGAQDLKYVHDALQPETTDAEATVFFTRLIESSLGSVATKFNFFIHNLAQLRFSGLPSNDEPILSFAPRTYTLKLDGRIRDASIFTFQKRYSPEKHYTYVVRVQREGQAEPQFVFRTFDEFQELHNKLAILFPLWKLPGFPNKMVLGRTHIKDVAAKRKVSEDGADPNPYVKTYLLPDPHKTSKRKTKISRKTRNPTFNEMLVYSGYSKETLSQRELQLSVLSAESLRENCCLGGVTLSLKDFDLSKETVMWYKLTDVPYF
ncbi:hypothetical protein JZ751_026011 [Albula glossodonta]|uniref:Phosphatidylinositol-4-phosphate 3-kinase n=1 Tax=Albula glossodonta TaxID=121402 RepID=A0A8T2MPA7_9TELE|nr:hypothetical protein JZ751_026011 [Albula glossodonta]